MFKALKLGAPDKEAPHHPTVIGKSAVIVGNLVSQDRVQLNGHVVGNIDVNGSPHAQLSVMPQGHVEGDINARQALVNGVVTGTTSPPMVVSSCMLAQMSKAIFHTPPWPFNTGPSSTE